MPKLEYVQPKKLNPADELREILDRLENGIPALKRLDSAETLALLDDLDQAGFLFDRLQASGMDLLPEEGRFRALQARLKDRAGLFLKKMGGPAALQTHQPRPAPDREERWWWYIDGLVAARQRALLKQVGIGLAVAVVVVGGLVLAFNTILAPSPETVAVLNAQNEAYTAILEGNDQEALGYLDQGLSQAPGDPSLLLIKGAIQHHLGEVEAARQSFDQAQAALNDPVTFHLLRSQLWLRLEQPVEAEQDARAVLALDDKSSRGWLLLAQALETQERRFEAVRAYEKAGDLALANNDNEVYVTVRMSLARLQTSP